MDEKTAELPIPADINSLVGQINAEEIKKQLASAMGKSFVTALGVGAAARGAKGLYNLVRRNMNPPRSPTESLVLSIPTARRDHEKFSAAPTQAECAQFHADLKKALGQEDASKEAGISDLLPNWLNPSQIAGGISDRLKGYNATGLADYPWAAAGIGTAAAGGLVGGYKATDWLLDKRRKIELQREEEDAKQQYEAALQQLVQPTAKMASEEGTLAADLDTLYGHVKAGMDYPGAIMNAVIGSWPLTAAAAGGLSYNFFKGRQQSKVLQKALARRQRQQLLNEPLYAFPDFNGKPQEPAYELEPEVEEALGYDGTKAAINFSSIGRAMAKRLPGMAEGAAHGLVPAESKLLPAVTHPLTSGAGGMASAAGGPPSRLLSRSVPNGLTHVEPPHTPKNFRPTGPVAKPPASSPFSDITPNEMASFDRAMSRQVQPQKPPSIAPSAPAAKPPTHVAPDAELSSQYTYRRPTARQELWRDVKDYAGLHVDPDLWPLAVGLDGVAAGTAAALGGTAHHLWTADSRMAALADNFGAGNAFVSENEKLQLGQYLTSQLQSDQTDPQTKSKLQAVLQKLQATP